MTVESGVVATKIGSSIRLLRLRVSLGKDILTGKVTHCRRLGTFCNRWHPTCCMPYDTHILAVRGNPEGMVPVAAVDPTSEVRLRHLTALAREVEARGLRSRLVGQEKVLLRVAHPRTGRGTMVVAMPTSRLEWSYLWGRGGQAAAADPALAADMIAAFLAG